MTAERSRRCLLFDWGDTVMRVFPAFDGPMCDWPRVDAMPGIDAVLAELRSQWTIALATNAVDSEEVEIRSALKRVGLDRLIDHVYCFRVIGCRKSEPGYFERVVEDLGLERDALVMVGDDFEGDILSANRSGIRAVWFNELSREVKTGDMYRTIHELRVLPEALEGLLKSSGD